MAATQDYYTMSEHRWDNNWQDSVSGWGNSANMDVPVWQYAQMPSEHDITYYSSASHASSSMNSPAISFQHDDIAPPPASIYQSRIPSSQPSPSYMEDDEEDSDSYSWGGQTPAAAPTSEAKSKHKSSKSSSSNNGNLSVKNAKRAHTVVERNYRERLNDKIADLGLYLFETSADSRTKPSKSLVMTRAMERLQQLEARNKSLEDEVVKLRQHIAILEHVVGEKKV